MRIILTDALTEPLEIAGIGEFFRQYLTWDYWSQKLPLIGSFAGRVLLAILVYVVASKIIHKLCKLIVASMNRRMQIPELHNLYPHSQRLPCISS